MNIIMLHNYEISDNSEKIRNEGKNIFGRRFDLYSVDLLLVSLFNTTYRFKGK